jgi:OOP family OmpA-OmpF porin
MFKKSLTVLVLLLVVNCSFSQSFDPFDKINSIYDEQNPVLSPDGRTVYFTRSRHPENVGGVIDLGDIWYSNLMPNGMWSEPINARRLNNKGWNGVLGFVGGSDVIYLFNHYSADNSLIKTQGIARSTKTTSSGWSFPENINVPYYKNTSEYHGGAITDDASVMVVSLESYGSAGGEDIYVCINKGNGQWSEPKNLGLTINTKYQEFSPFLSADKKTLYFSSNGHNSEGGTDIYYAERLDDTWINWSTPVSFSELNTEGKEQGMHLYGNTYFYTSTLNSDGYGDLKIYIDPESEEPTPLDTTVVVQPTGVTIAENQPIFDDKVITLYGNTINKKDKKAVEAKISLKTTGDEPITVVKSEKGSYALKIDAIGDYLLRVEALGYISHQEMLELKSNEINAFEMNFTLDPIEVGTTVNLKDVLFQQSKAEFLESSYPELNLVAEFMKENPKVKIRLEGHTDNRGIAKYNVKLSKDRVEAVKKYLVRKGISSKRISGKGYGGSRPIADNEDPAKRVLNRRVEFTIVKN